MFQIIFNKCNVFTSFAKRETISYLKIGSILEPAEALSVK